MSQEENERFTRVGRGTPGGELLRRYWWPVGFADHVKGTKPVTAKLLGEEFVLFRDGKGRVGMLDLLCARRRTTLKRGRVERDGLRCCYYGWLFDVTGKCLDQPCEEQDSTFKDKVRQVAYRMSEHLAPSDHGVTMFRAMLRAAITAIEQGRDPINVIRDLEENWLVQFGTHQQ